MKSINDQDNLNNKKEVKFADHLDYLKASTFVQENCPESLTLKQEMILRKF